MKTSLRPPFILLGLLTFCLSALLGMGFAKAIDSPYGMVDPIDASYEAGYATYVQKCSTCHVALPAAVLPLDTWQALITDPAHYGVTLTGISRFDQRLMLSYLQTYSRRHEGRGPTPYRLQNSAYFQALHPDVALPQPLNLRSCVSCHQGATEQNYSPVSTQN
ncbi:MAG: hypothetical protein ACFB0D_22430 [Phormidesmis sp.]